MFSRNQRESMFCTNLSKVVKMQYLASIDLFLANCTNHRELQCMIYEYY